MRKQVLAVAFTFFFECICVAQKPTPVVTGNDCAQKYANSEFCDDTEPQYTAEALKANVKGKLLVAFTWGTDGCPQDIRVVRRLGFGLDEAAIYAVRRFRLRPRSNPVPLTVEFNFDPKRPYPSTRSTAPTCEELVQRERTKK